MATALTIVVILLLIIGVISFLIKIGIFGAILDLFD
jgi:hypothetical protein